MSVSSPGWRTAVVVALAVALVFLGLLWFGLMPDDQWYAWWPHFSLAEVIGLIRQAGHWGVAASMALMVAHSFVPFPAELVALANGMVYGWLWGTVITWAGAMIGAASSFALSRRFGRPFVEATLGDARMHRMDAWLARYGEGSLMFSRFVPVIAFNLINYAAGLTRIRWWSFLWITGVGILPLTALMVAVGDHWHRVPGWGWILLPALGLVMWVATHRLTRRSR